MVQYYIGNQPLCSKVQYWHWPSKILVDQYPPGVKLTGVKSSGVEIGDLSLFSLIPLPKSKSQIFTGEIYRKEKNNPFKYHNEWS